MAHGVDILPQSGLSLVVAGGGTGGHLFPGIAVAEALLERLPGSRVLFVNAGRPLERRILSRGNWPYHAITVEGIKGRGRPAQVRAAARLPGALAQSYTVIRCHRPDVVLGVGGYSSGPVVAAARMLGVPTALHEQNLLPGVTNRILSHLVDRIYLSFEQSRRAFPAAKVLVTGNPVRRRIIRAARKAKTGIPAGPPTLLVIGGSQGAHRINLALAEGAGKLAEVGGLRIMHQTGQADLEMVAAAYAAAGLEHEVKPFFDSMDRRYLEATLVVCRAGASTVAEITVLGKPAVLIPFAQAADDHQRFNARSLEAAGAAEVVPEKELSPEALAQRIVTLLEDRQRLEKMAAAARALGNPNAAEDIAGDLMTLAAGKNRWRRPLKDMAHVS